MFELHFLSLPRSFGDKTIVFTQLWRNTPYEVEGAS